METTVVSKFMDFILSKLFIKLKLILTDNIPRLNLSFQHNFSPNLMSISNIKAVTSTSMVRK